MPQNVVATIVNVTWYCYSLLSNFPVKLNWDPQFAVVLGARNIYFPSAHFQIVPFGYCLAILALHKICMHLLQFHKHLFFKLL